MEKLLVILGTTLGGWLGWWAGARMVMMTAFILSIVGTAAGLYMARRWVANHL